MTVVDGEKAVLDCRVAVTPAAEVTWYVDTSFTVRGLRAGADCYFRVVAESGASQPLTLDRSFVPRTPRSVRRDAIQRDALLARPDVERRSGDGGLRHSSGPNTCHRRGRASRGSSRSRPSTRSATAENVEGTGPPLTLATRRRPYYP